MPHAAEEKKKDENELKKADPADQAREEKKESPVEESGMPGGLDRAGGAAKGGEQEKKKEQRPPTLMMAQPASGAAYAKGAEIGMGGEIDGTANEEVSATFVLHDAAGKVVQRLDQPVKLNAEGKGLVNGLWMTEALGLAAGKYSLHCFAQGEAGASPIQKIDFELIDEGKKDEEGAAPNVEGDVIETKGGGV